MPSQSGHSFRSLVGIPTSTPTVNDSVLVVVDAQNEYDHGKLAIVDVEKSSKVIGDVLEKYRSGAGDVVHVLHDTPEGAPLFTPGTELSEEMEGLKPRDGEKIVHKSQPCSFTGTDLHTHLQGIGRQKIVLAGYMAHVCISSTARIGAELGYDVSVIRDGIGDRDIPGAKATQLVETVLAELGDVAATIIESSSL